MKYNLLDSTEYDQVISIDRNVTLRELKEKLVPLLDVKSINEFKIKQQYSINSEWKDLDKTLFDMKLTNDKIVSVVRGIPLNPDQYNFKLVFKKIVSLGRMYIYLIA